MGREGAYLYAAFASSINVCSKPCVRYHHRFARSWRALVPYRIPQALQSMEQQLASLLQGAFRQLCRHVTDGQAVARAAAEAAGGEGTGLAGAGPGTGGTLDPSAAAGTAPDHRAHLQQQQLQTQQQQQQHLLQQLQMQLQQATEGGNGAVLDGTAAPGAGAGGLLQLDPSDPAVRFGLGQQQLLQSQLVRVRRPVWSCAEGHSAGRHAVMATLALGRPSTHSWHCARGFICS